jgi:hypothetical protein
MLDLVVRARQADNIGVELTQVPAQHFGGIASRITGNENGAHDVGSTGCFADFINNGSHLIQLIGADIWTVGETKIDLNVPSLAVVSPSATAKKIKERGKTHKIILSF